MPDIPCPDKVSGCDCPELSPFKNISAEAPDPPIFIATYYGKQPPPMGMEYARFTCTGVCISETSQLDADLCAQRAALECIVDTWRSDGSGPANSPGPPPQNTRGTNRVRTFLSQSQNTSVSCPDGLPFLFSVPAGLFRGLTQLEADTQALTYAQQLAQQAKVCLSGIPPKACNNESYFQTITASGAFVGAENVWELFGTLPPGLTIPELIVTTALAGPSIHITGQPTTLGTYNFTIQITDTAEHVMSKPYQITVVGFTNADAMPHAPVGVPYVFILDAQGFTNAIYSIESGSFPTGLTIDSLSGQIFGTPTVVGTFDFVVGVTEAGTGVTCSAQAEIVVEGCAMPALTSTFPMTANVNSTGVAFRPAVGPTPNYLAVCDLGNAIGSFKFFNLDTQVIDASGGPTTALIAGIYYPPTDMFVFGANGPIVSRIPATPPYAGLEVSLGGVGTANKYLAIDATLGVVFAAGGRTATIWNPVTLAVVAQINFGAGVIFEGMAYKESTKKLYLLQRDTTQPVKLSYILVYDVSGLTFSFQPSIALPQRSSGTQSSDSFGMLYCPSTDTLYVQHEIFAPVEFQMVRLNATTGAQTNSTVIPTPQTSNGTFVYNSLVDEILWADGGGLMHVICASSDAEVGTINTAVSMQQGVLETVDNAVAAVNGGTLYLFQ